MILLGIVTPPLICGIILCTQKVIEYIDAPDQAWKIAGRSLYNYIDAQVHFLYTEGHQYLDALDQAWKFAGRSL